MEEEKENKVFHFDEVQKLDKENWLTVLRQENLRNIQIFTSSRDERRRETSRGIKRGNEEAGAKLRPLH